MADNNNILLKVENMSQYFKLGDSELKAVDNISFEIKKGEVFGLVGESGCGKTTTGRSIIKLYDITSGNVYFKGRRICAGTRSYREAIKNAKRSTYAAIKELKLEEKNELKELSNSGFNNEKINEVKLKFKNLINAEKDNLAKVIKDNIDQINLAKHDHKYCDKDYVQEKIKKIEEHYNSLPHTPENEKEKRQKLKLAKKERLITKIQMIYQDPIASLNPRMTVKDIIAEGLIVKGIKDKKFIEQKVYEVLEMVGLVREHAARYPHEFSGGQRQRIGVARSIILEPELIIADEPVSALDVSIQAQVINLLNDLRHRLGLTILFIAHDLSVVKYFSDRIGVMYFGKMVELASSDELFAHPLHPYTKSLLSAIPFPDPHYEKQRKRIIYNPDEHDYSVDKPKMREIKQGHFVYCNETEYKKYKKEIGLSE
ncbi:MAG TPA: ATP-binding cassette domain-containing protein [Clostridia bacterium]